MGNFNLIFVANELDNNNLNGPNVVFFNLIKAVCLNGNEFDNRFKFYFLVPENFHVNYNESQNVNFIKIKSNNKFVLFFIMLSLKKLGNNYVIFYPKLTYFPFFKNQFAF